MRMTVLHWPIVVTLAIGFSVCPFSLAQVTHHQQQQGSGIDSQVGHLTGHSPKAAQDYRRYCAGCHGNLGDGNGENALWLDPKPRDFTAAVFKCRSTPTGTLPTDEDLFDSISRGLDRSNMPSWNTFTKQQRVDLVAWIKHFSPRWQTEKAGTPIQIPPEPEVTLERIKAGHEIFDRVQCWKCHGVTGRANGPSAATLTDDQNRPILAYNFQEGARPKCGDTDHDLYRIFMTGMDGTPMPSFAESIKPQEAWDLVFYLRTLQAQGSKAKTTATKLDFEPVDSGSPAAPKQ